MNNIILKYEYIINKIRFLKGVFVHKGKITPSTTNSINTGAFSNGQCSLAQNNMYVDNNMIVDTWEYLESALVTSIEVLFALLGFLDKSAHKSL